MREEDRRAQLGFNRAEVDRSCRWSLSVETKSESTFSEFCAFVNAVDGAQRS
jgi:hypothetical protein